MNEKLKDKLLKLYELSKSGVGGEKVNAEMFLNKLLEKNNLTIDDIDANVLKKRFYPYTTLESKTLVNQVLYKVTNRTNMYALPRYKEVCMEVSDYEHVQVVEEVDFHRENYVKERKQFIKDFKDAYVQKHRLFPANSKSSDRELTTEEKQAIWRMSAIKGVMSNKSYTKKIG